MSIFPNLHSTREWIADHFRKRQIPLSEDAILAAIEARRSKWDVYLGVLALRDLGTARSIPVLKSLIHYPMQDVKDSAVLTIAHIAGPSETPFFLEALAHKRSQKTYPMWAIEAAADERAFSPVINFVNIALRKWGRGRGTDRADAYIYGLKYLARLGLDRRACQPTVDLLRKAWPNLPERHRTELRAALPPWSIAE